VSDNIITVENVGKKYNIRHQQRNGARYNALRDVLADQTKSIARRVWSALRNPKPSKSLAKSPSSEDFWALKDVSFEVKRGDVLGIIGRNGAGKSTLLKILSRITEPSEGRVTLRGRVASLLEVGTGFHPELTGRENIFLNGSILGMHRAEIKQKFDEIVAFAEVENFLDTPVKRYSSGMYVRLAFAVAAHLEPEILIVDEVLAVGDAEFQKKCLGKMQEVSRSGRTVLFVSHQMAAVQNLCQTGVVLSLGRVVQTGLVADVVKRYFVESSSVKELRLDEREDRSGNGALRFKGVTLRNIQGKNSMNFACGSPAFIDLSIANLSGKPLRAVRICAGVDNYIGERILIWSTHLADEDFPKVGVDVEGVRIHIPCMTLAPGRYGFTLFASINGEVADWIKNAGRFDVEAGDFYGSGRMPDAGQGCFVMNHTFTLCTVRQPQRAAISI
jgi:lipopolysaccharide transport system ATP-binding protein